tara:strand:- start:5502 stop:6320 length:819 start_codon:yes stop_codon:yes gene_type:complete
MATQNIKPAGTPLTEAQKRRKKTVGSAEQLAELKRKQLDAARSRLGVLGGSQASERESLALKGQAAQQEMSRQAGKLYAQGVSASPFSGATARISAGAQIAEQTSRQQEEAKLRQQAAEAQLRAGQRREMTAAEQAVAGAEDDVVVQEQQVTEVQEKLPDMAEQHGRNTQPAIDEVNTIIDDEVGVLWDSDKKAAARIRSYASTFKDTDPKMERMLRHIAYKIQTKELPKQYSESGDIGHGVAIDFSSLEWPWNSPKRQPPKPLPPEWDFGY